MQIYCTTCSKDKSTKEGRIPAIQRYRDQRINSVYHQSQIENKGFRILSGKYGLLSPTDEIPWYDQALLPHEVENMIELIATRLKSENIDFVLFFAKNPKENPDWEPYVNAIIGACEKADTKLEIKLID